MAYHILVTPGDNAFSQIQLSHLTCTGFLGSYQGKREESWVGNYSAQSAIGGPKAHPQKYSDSKAQPSKNGAFPVTWMAGG